MKNIKIAVAALVIAAGSIGAFAFTKAEKEVKKAPVTYYVTGQIDPNHYTVQLAPPDDSQCGLGSVKPCEIRTTATPTGDQMLASDVNDPAQTNIVSKQPNFSL